MDAIKHKTTREHYEKYQAMKIRLGVSYDGSTLFGSKKHLIELYKEDPLLNNISLYRFDGMYGYLRSAAIQAGYKCFSMAENTCLAKHCLIYEVIGAEPEFTD